MANSEHRTNLHGERIVLNGLVSKATSIGDDDWCDFEKLVGLKFSTEIRERIRCYLDLFYLVDSLYWPENTVLVSKLIPLLDKWVLAGQKLLEALGGEELDVQSRKAIVQFLNPEKVQTLTRKLPSGLLLFAAQSAMAAANLARKEIQSEDRNLPPRADLWSAWVCLTAKTLQEAGLKISGASTDKSLNESPFITGVVKLQSFLPKESRHYDGYESVRIAAQQSLRTMGEMSDEMLMEVLCWGMQLHGWSGYPGGLRESKEQIREFEERVRKKKQEIAIRNQKSAIDYTKLFPWLRTDT
jgi:hypothetical protein